MATKNNLIAQITEPPLDNRPLPVPDQSKENSLVQTFEPYEQPSTSTTHHSSRGRGGGRGRGGAHRSATNNENDEDQGWINPSQQRKNIRQRKKQRKLRELKLDMNNLNEMNTNTFPKYYSVKFPRKDIDNDIPSIAVDKDIHSNIGKPKNIKKQNKDTLLIEVQSENQGKKVMQIKKLGGLEVQVTEHKALNQCKGTVVSRAMSNSTIEELTEALADQKVINVERMKIMKNGELIETHRYIITFDKPDLPPVVRITSWHIEPIDLFIPTPMRCLNCQRIGHTKKRCRRNEPTCSQCSEEGHISKECRKTPPKCINCGQEHNSMNKTCPYFQFKREVIATVTKEKLTFQEAEEKVKDTFRENEKQYSFAVKRNTPRENNQTEQQTGATALPEKTLPPLREMVVDEPDTMVKQTTDNKNEKDATKQSTKETTTTEDSTDNQSQHQKVKDNSLQPEKKLEASTTNETGTRNQENMVEDTTANTNKAHKGSQEKQTQGSMKRGPEHFSPVKQDNRKKVNVENTAKIPVLGASNSSGAGWRDLRLQPPPPPPDKPPPFGSAKPQTKEPDRHRGRSYDRDKDNSGRPSRSESRGRNGRNPSKEEVDHSVWRGQCPKYPNQDYRPG